jgi:hypothetical protein
LASKSWGKLIAEYGGPASTSNAATSYLTTDHLGSTRVVTRPDQSVVGRHDYLPFGGEISVGPHTWSGLQQHFRRHTPEIHLQRARFRIGVGLLSGQVLLGLALPLRERRHCCRQNGQPADP